MPFLAVLALACSTQVGAALDLAKPPAGGIYDPGNFLDEEFEKVIRQRITYEKNFRQFEIFLVLLEESPEQPVEKLAKQLGQEWATGEFWSVIYQVGPTSEPNSVVGGNLLKALREDTVEKALLNSRNVALMTTTPQNRLEDLVNRTAEEFGFLNQLAQKNVDDAAAANLLQLKQRAKQEDLARVAAATLSLVALVLLGLAIWFWKKVVQKMQPKTFPLTEPRKRLGGSSSGGGDVLVKYGK